MSTNNDSQPCVKHLHILFLTVFAILILLSASVSSQAASFSIVSVPSPLPSGKVGESYSVKFKTTLTAGYKVDWSCNPANPVPGLSFSAMSQAAEITLSGTPAQAGAFTFTLRAVYKEPDEVATAQFTITITPYFNIIVEQTEPVDPLHLPPRPKDIYEGDYCRFDVYTDHPDGVNAHLSWTVSGSVPDLRVRPLKGRTLTDSPSIFLEGNATTAGTYWVTVTVVDTAGHRATRSFPVTIHPAYCNLRIHLNETDIIWDTTPVIYESISDVTQVLRKGIEIRVERFCKGKTSDVKFKLYVKGVPDGSRIVEGLRTDPSALNETTYTLYRFWATLNDDEPIFNGSFAFIIDDPLKLARVFPGKNYSVEICGIMEGGYTAKCNVTLRILFHVPKLTISNLRPISQLPNPNHIVAFDLVAGKQATFRFDYTLNFAYPINVTLRLTFPCSQWDLGIPECLTQSYERSITVYPPTDGGTEFYIEEQLILEPTGTPVTRIFLLKMEAPAPGSMLPFCFPVPKCVTPVSVTLDLIREGKLEGPAIPNPIHFTESFKPWVHDGNIKLGYFLMNDSLSTFFYDYWFPMALSKYISGMFPVKVKNVTFIGYVERPSTREAWAGNASRLSEETVEANLDRAVVIVPDDALDLFDAIGIVFGAGRRVAFVETHYAYDYEYLPVVAHELSHTLGYPDIYFGTNFATPFCISCDCYGYTGNASSHEGCSGVPYVLGYWAYFNEIDGGLIKIGMQNSTKDIMACYYNKYQWAYHSWLTVALRCIGFEDPPNGLLVSLLVFRNGTVIGKPFTRLYNHSQPFLLTNAIGNSYLKLFSRDGSMLRSYPFNITDESFKIYGTDLETDFTSLVEVVEWFNDLGKIEFVGPDGKVWFSRAVSLNEPEVSIEYPFQGMKLKKGGTYRLKWRGNDADGDNLWFNVQIRRSNESSWMIIAHRTTENTVSFTVPESFEEGNYVLMVKATDGVNTGYDIVNLQILESLPVYTLNVSSNIGIQIEGSGNYEEWSNVTLTAPQAVPLEGVLGILGGKYVFQEWAGFTNTRQNTVSIIILGEEKTLTMKAIYTQDLTVVYIASAALVLALAFATLIMVKRRRKPASPLQSSASTPQPT